MSDSEPKLLNGWGRSVLGSYLYLALLPLIYLLVTFWPLAASAGEAPVQVPILGRTMELTREQAMLWAVAILGALGGSLHAAASFSVYTGNRTLKSSWVWWYLARWPVGAGLALVFYMVIRAGLLNVASNGGALEALNPYGVGTAASLTGLFSEVALRKLREVFETLFRPAQSKDPVTASAPNPTRVDPSSLAVGAGTLVKLLGSDFEHGDEVMLDGVELATRFVSASELEVTLPANKVAQAGELSLVVRRGGPAGARSQPVKITVS